MKACIHQVSYSNIKVCRLAQSTRHHRIATRVAMEAARDVTSHDVIYGQPIRDGRNERTNRLLHHRRRQIQITARSRPNDWPLIAFHENQLLISTRWSTAGPSDGRQTRQPFSGVPAAWLAIASCPLTGRRRASSLKASPPGSAK